ncbi:hypothetical protein LMG27952_03067 [Paraburkholderia hiiakae]|uniref:Uncharacterized protein n=1 Tax=Paraburkholderia hiiakae TaxID=1081782 RepID=A0ABM8NNY7_9BURK|nr:hypothetical protein [Paraburkholderia hiiakae]CAD6535769.1 hypothetical protein LMG27952_03067 [Paraburkholderia hiiakae]
MHTERLGHFEVELSARQMIHNGGWAAFAAIHAVEAAADEPAAAVFPRQWVVDETVFESEAAAIAGCARGGARFSQGRQFAQPGRVIGQSPHRAAAHKVFQHQQETFHEVVATLSARQMH